jgi:carbon monoxide dehydrogenase subunit G
MNFEGQFKVPGTPDDVIREFADVERMATLMPGAAIEGRDEEGNYLGGMTVAFGPKRIKFKGKVTVETDIAGRSGKMRGRGAADMRAARIETRLVYTLHADETAGEPTTIVKLKAEADLQGVLAEFAKTGGEAVGNVLMEEFANNMAAEFGRKKGAAPVASSAGAAPTMAAAPAREPQAALSASNLMWRVIKLKFAQWFGGKK